jgi:hypothetical protein
MNKDRLSWGAVIKGAISLVLLPFLFATMMTTAAGIAIGFETRGDSEAIQRGLAGVVQTIEFRGAALLVAIVISTWRGALLARICGSSTPPALIAMMALATALSLTIGLIMDPGFNIAWLATQWVLFAVAAACGAAFARRRAQPRAQFAG